MGIFEHFDEYYDKYVKPYEEQLCKERKKCLMHILIGCIVLIILVWSFGLILDRYKTFHAIPNFENVTIMLLMFDFVFLAGSIAYIIYVFRKYMQKIKLEIIAPIMQGLSYSPTATHSSDFRPSKDLATYDYCSSSDCATGRVNGESFWVAEIRLEEEYKDSEGYKSYRTTFNGLYIKIRVNFDIETKVKIHPDLSPKLLNSTVAGMKKLFGANKNVVRLENPEFERYFEAYSEDQVGARKLLTLNFIEKLVKFRKKYKKDMTLLFSTNHEVAILINNLKLINEMYILRKGISKEIIYKSFEVIQDFFNLL